MSLAWERRGLCIVRSNVQRGRGPCIVKYHVQIGDQGWGLCTVRSTGLWLMVRWDRIWKWSHWKTAKCDTSTYISKSRSILEKFSKDCRFTVCSIIYHVRDCFKNEDVECDYLFFCQRTLKIEECSSVDSKTCLAIKASGMRSSC